MDIISLLSFHFRGPYEYELILSNDLYTHKHTQWYYFRVGNAIPGVEYTFTIVNLTKVIYYNIIIHLYHRLPSIHISIYRRLIISCPYIAKIIQHIQYIFLYICIVHHAVNLLLNFSLIVYIIMVCNRYYIPNWMHIKMALVGYVVVMISNIIKMKSSELK